MAARDLGSSQRRLTFDVDDRPVNDQVAPPEFHTALQRKLQNRHVAMISIGGVIGTGLFIGTAPSLMNGGPLGLLLVYTFMGTLCVTTMVLPIPINLGHTSSHLPLQLSLGEMTAYLPIPGGFIKLAERFVDPAFAFATGWNYWYQWALTLPAELSAAAAIIKFWDTNTNSAVWITVCLVVVVGINALGVGAYGETEFWFSSIKFLTITGLIILGIVVDLGGGPSHDFIGFRYWKNPGPFTNYHGFTGPKGHFLGTCSVATQAMFAYVGTEAVAIAAAEARNPRRNIPKAIRKVYIRVLVFYIGGVFVIGLLVPSSEGSLDLDSGNASASPFVIAFKKAGIKVLPSIINAAILTSAWSAGSSDLYLASRSLYGLAVSGSAPKIFSRTTRSGVPHVAVGVCSCFALLAYLTIGDGSGKVFIWFSGFSSTAGLVTWFGIGVTYLRFHKGLQVQGIERSKLPYAPRFQPFMGWWTVCGSAFSLVFSAWYVFLDRNWSTTTFVTNYTPIILFPILYVVAKFVKSARPVKAHNMDFDTNVAEFDNMTYGLLFSYDDPPPRNIFEAFWSWI
ncbi:amino acid permease [Boletus edulis BED1]|uniref:Amino acid permease n=1 Tax=Boletus edulis BED1 TaxID=1328754 RepID=A0AAD4BJM6_BOLED|nr:amino acid permease [Boletus edulis BED1]